MENKFRNRRPALYAILMALVSFLCALFFWVYVTESKGVVIDRSFNGVQVVFEGETTLRETRGLIITEVDFNSVNLRLSGYRSTLTSLNAADITAVVDLSSITSSGVYSLAYKTTYPGNIDASAISVLSSNADKITFKVEKLDTKTVEVTGVFSGSVAEGYSAGQLEFSPSTVIITGPESELQRVAYAWVEVTRDDVSQTQTFQSVYTLIDVDGNEVVSDSIDLSHETVTVTLPIVAIKEIDLIVTFISGGGATENDVIWSLEPNKITLSGDAETLEGINSISVHTIDLSKVTENVFTDTYTIVIPNDTKIISGPKETTLSMEIKGLETKKMEVTNISCINYTEGYTVNIITESLEVTIRGKQSVLAGISANNIRAVADLSEFSAAAGTLTVPVKIYVDGTTEAGALGEYEISVSVTR